VRRSRRMALRAGSEMQSSKRVARSLDLRRLPGRGSEQSLFLNGRAEVSTQTDMLANPTHADRYRRLGFEMFWSSLAR
jgi:hypothetical protein